MLYSLGRVRVACFFGIVLVFSTMGLIQAQTKQKIIAVYEYGETMINLSLEEKRRAGMGPAELEGVRMGMEQALAVNEISITFLEKGILIFTNGKEKNELEYTIDGIFVKVKRKDTGDFVDFGAFSKDKKKFVLMKKLVLDKRE